MASADDDASTSDRLGTSSQVEQANDLDEQIDTLTSQASSSSSLPYPRTDPLLDRQEQEIRELVSLAPDVELEEPFSFTFPSVSRNTSLLESNLDEVSDFSTITNIDRETPTYAIRRNSRSLRTPRTPAKQQCVSFCACPKTGRDLQCKCGEEDEVFDWCWDTDENSEACELNNDNRTVMFHMNYSSGTAAARGNQQMIDGQYFWEIKMTSPVYGTDMMVGVGTEAVKMDSYKHSFTSMLGKDDDSCGLSYYGRLQQKGKFRDVPGGKFAQGSIVGVHADLWRGILTFYINRKELAEKCYGMQRRTLYPMVSSTAARTSMKIIKASSFKTSLQFLCCQTLRQIIPRNLDVLNALELPPGLRAFLSNNLSWLFRPSELESESSSSLSSSKSSSTKRKFSDLESHNEPFLGPLSHKRHRGEDSHSSSGGVSEREEEEAMSAAVSSSQLLPGLMYSLASSGSSEASSDEESPAAPSRSTYL